MWTFGSVSINWQRDWQLPSIYARSYLSPTSTLPFFSCVCRYTIVSTFPTGSINVPIWTTDKIQNSIRNSTTYQNQGIPTDIMWFCSKIYGGGTVNTKAVQCMRHKRREADRSGLEQLVVLRTVYSATPLQCGGSAVVRLFQGGLIHSQISSWIASATVVRLWILHRWRTLVTKKYSKRKMIYRALLEQP